MRINGLNFEHEFSRYEFNGFLIENGCVGFFDQPITLKSGRLSWVYYNFRNLVSTKELKDRLVEWVGRYVRDKGLQPDYYLGVPEGGTKLGLFLSDKFGKGKLCMARGKPKKHGELKDRCFIGPVEQGDRVVLIEDVTTTGSSLLEWIDHLFDVGVVLDAALVLGNRLELTEDGRPVARAVEEKGVDFHALTDSTTLLPMAFERLKPGEGIGRKIVEYFDEYGTKFEYRRES